jgi:competence protein ComFC
MTPRALLGIAADALFPPRCLLCDEVLGFLPECPACRGALARLSRGHAPGITCAPPALDGAFAAFWYEDGVREAVHRMKYQDRPDLARLFAAHMAAALPEGLGADGVIPVPSARKRLAQRGYDVPLLLARHLARAAGMPLCTGLLQKVRETPPQAQLSGEERRRNLKGAFRAHTPGAVRGRAFLLADDVFTTGSTMEECARALKKAGAVRVYALTAAVTRFGV